MAVIANIEQAIARVRLLIDKSDSPYMTGNEIIEFLQLAATEFVTKRVGVFGANQKIRDDLGGVIEQRSFINLNSWGDGGTPFGFNIGGFLPGDSELESDLDLTFQLTGSSEVGGNDCVKIDLSSLDLNFDYLLSMVVRKAPEAFIDAEYIQPESFYGPTEYVPVKILELDELPSVNRDPFNAPSRTEFRAIRNGDIYEVYPAQPFRDAEVFHNNNTRPDSYKIILTYVSLNAISQIIDNLPVHSREEVCQIAARKILGVVADERYGAASGETQELRN